MFAPGLIDRYRKVRAYVDRGATEGERAAARNVIEGMERDNPGLGAAVVAADEDPAVRRRADPPPPAPSWSVHRTQPPPKPGSHADYDPNYDPYAPPPGFGTARAVWVDPDAFNGRPWEARTSNPRRSPSRSRWEDRHAAGDIFDDFGELPSDYGKHSPDRGKH